MTVVWVIWAAVVLDLLIGDPRWLPHPVIGMGKAIRRVEGWIRQQATTAQSLKRAGILLPVIVAGGSFVLAWLPLELCGRFILG